MVRRSFIVLVFSCLVASASFAQDDELLAAAATVAPTPAPPWPDYTFTLEDRLVAAQACVSEASWAGGSRTVDCGGILQVIMERRRTARDGRRAESFADAARRTMRRFFGGLTSRSWALGLGRHPIRANPVGWPEDAPPATHYSDSWRAVYARTQRFIDGEEPLPCSPAPRRWGGRGTDHDSIAVWIADGWAESDCGAPAPGETHASVNAFLYPVPAMPRGLLKLGGGGHDLYATSL